MSRSFRLSPYLMSHVYSGSNTVNDGDLGIGVASSPSGFAPYIDSNIGYFQGAIDDVRIYDTALSAQEIAQLAAPPSVPEPSTWLFIATGVGTLLVYRLKFKNVRGA